MKSLFIKSISFALVAIGLWSCKKEGTQLTSTISPAGALTASVTSLNLSLANSTATALTLSFPAPAVTGYPVGVISTIQFDLKGKNFSNPKEVVINTNTYAPKVSEINAMLLSLDQKPDISTQLEVRLKSAPAANAITYSNVITLTATPYSASSWVYVPGAYQGWKPETADSLVSLNSDGIYAGVIVFTQANLEFKITPLKDFNIAYGDAGSGTISTTAGDNLKAPLVGPQQVVVNMNTKTFVIEKPALWSLIGSATPLGWDGDTDMKFINDGKGLWKVTTNLTVGELKFRLNHDWGTNYGGSGGNAVLGSPDNIKVAEAGNYTVSLDLTNLKYTLIKN